MVRLEITGEHASALDGMQWGGEAGRRVMMAVMVERGRWARGTCLVVGREGSRDLRLNGRPCVGGNGCRRACESVLQERWRVAGVCLTVESERCGGGSNCLAWRERGKVGFSEWKGRSVGGDSERQTSDTGNTQKHTRLHCTRVVMMVLMGEAVLGWTGGVVDNGAHWAGVVVGEQDRQIKPAAAGLVVLLCERALWPGEANAQPPVCRALIGGAGWDYAQQSPVPGFVGCRTIAGGGCCSS
jgi:hypothetical protein